MSSISLKCDSRVSAFSVYKGGAVPFWGPLFRELPLNKTRLGGGSRAAHLTRVSQLWRGLEGLSRNRGFLAPRGVRRLRNVSSSDRMPWDFLNPLVSHIATLTASLADSAKATLIGTLVILAPAFLIETLIVAPRIP